MSFGVKIGDEGGVSLNLRNGRGRGLSLDLRIGHAECLDRMTVLPYVPDPK